VIAEKYGRVQTGLSIRKIRGTTLKCHAIASFCRDNPARRFALKLDGSATVVEGVQIVVHR
jgi:hypothetical protein